ncbi:MAG: hypothetical protein RLZZ135_2522, partial [Cyanobacteriota bacterium]|jgi:hypothetical protein
MQGADSFTEGDILAQFAAKEGGSAGDIGGEGHLGSIAGSRDITAAFIAIIKFH